MPNHPADDSANTPPQAPPKSPDNATPVQGELEWYYAVQDQRHGPVAFDEIRGLMRAGEISDHDLIWRAGMADWEPAARLDLLKDPSASPAIDVDVAESSTADSPPTLQAKRRLQQVGTAAGTQAAAWTRWLRDNVQSRTWVLVGLLLVMFSRGCDSLGQKGVARLAAIVSLEKSEWEADYSARQLVLSAKIEQLDKKGGTRSELDKLETSLKELEDEQRTRRAELERGVWKTLADDAQQAADRYAIASYWRQWLLMLGAVVLTCSLGVVATSERTPDRWVAMMMLAILLWSLLVGGAAW